VADLLLLCVIRDWLDCLLFKCFIVLLCVSPEI